MLPTRTASGRTPPGPYAPQPGRPPARRASGPYGVRAARALPPWGHLPPGCPTRTAHRRLGQPPSGASRPHGTPRLGHPAARAARGEGTPGPASHGGSALAGHPARHRGCCAPSAARRCGRWRLVVVVCSGRVFGSGGVVVGGLGGRGWLRGSVLITEVREQCFRTLCGECHPMVLRAAGSGPRRQGDQGSRWNSVQCQREPWRSTRAAKARTLVGRCRVPASSAASSDTWHRR